MTTAIWWIRRDLRLADNPALSSALASADRVVPVFVLDPKLLEANRAARKRLAFLFGGLRAIDADLRRIGSKLLVRRGDPSTRIPELVAELGAQTVFAEEDYTAYSQRRDSSVMELSPLRLVSGVTVVRPGDLLKSDGTPYVVYSPFSRAWKALKPPSRADLLPAPEHIVTPTHLQGEAVPDEPIMSHDVPFYPGEGDGLRRLEDFVARSGSASSGPAGVFQYEDLRDRVDLHGTSELSPYLRFGMVSARRAVVEAIGAAERAESSAMQKAAQNWLNELIWREFYVHILAHFPAVARSSFRENLRQIEWANDRSEFEAWRLGETGYPIVDAGIRQLAATGWMHNRARMITASFLVKDLLVDWRWGERAFMQHLVDGDQAANNGGWQWTAGTGTDSAPYFRVFNPVLQGKKHDPDGSYVRRWIPELAGVPGRRIHAPWEMTNSEQSECGVEIGRDYPAPIVDHAYARERVLAAYAAARSWTPARG
jgi:deoxyribodipyrimidine photo-lyase